MIRRPTCAGRLNATEPKFSQIEGCNEGVDHANRIVICNPVVQAFRQQSRLPAISSLNETSHASPHRFSAGIIAGTAFSHSQGHKRRFGRERATFGLAPITVVLNVAAIFTYRPLPART